jgi:hypothetical protein
VLQILFEGRLGLGAVDDRFATADAGDDDDRGQRQRRAATSDGRL